MANIGGLNFTNPLVNTKNAKAGGGGGGGGGGVWGATFKAPTAASGPVYSAIDWNRPNDPNWIELNNHPAWDSGTQLNQASPSSSPPAWTDPTGHGLTQAQYNSLVSGFGTQKQGIYDTSNAAAGAYGDQYGRGILDFLDQQRQGQTNIDTQAAKNELAKIQGVAGVLGMVGRGIKSGGVMLAGKNAGNSSAAQGIANAYGEQGRRQLGSVGNQYALGNQDVQTAQDNYAVQQASGVRNLQGGKNDAINNIVNQAQEKFYALDAQIANASLPDRLAIDQEKQNVRNQVMQQLQQFDSQLNQGVQNIHATNADERRAKAQQLASQGQDLGAGAFDYTTETPGQFQNGPFTSDLPLFSLNKRKFA